MTCCINPKICDVTGKCSDLIDFYMPNGERIFGEYPDWSHNLITKYDYISFSFCMNCGKIQGDFHIESE